MWVEGENENCLLKGSSGKLIDGEQSFWKILVLGMFVKDVQGGESTK